jgi:hypothetical protein
MTRKQSIKDGPTIQELELNLASLMLEMSKLIHQMVYLQEKQLEQWKLIQHEKSKFKPFKLR